MRKKPTFEELVGARTPALQRPNRPALAIVKSAQFNVWNEAAGAGMLEQSQRHQEHLSVANQVRTAAQTEGVPAHELKASLEEASHKQIAAIQAASSLREAEALQQRVQVHGLHKEMEGLRLEMERRNNLADAQMQVEPMQNVVHSATYVNAPQTYMPVHAPTTVNVQQNMTQQQLMQQVNQTLNVHRTDIVNQMLQQNMTVNQAVAQVFGAAGPSSSQFQTPVGSPRALGDGPLAIGDGPLAIGASSSSVPTFNMAAGETPPRKRKIKKRSVDGAKLTAEDYGKTAAALAKREQVKKVLLKIDSSQSKVASPPLAKRKSPTKKAPTRLQQARLSAKQLET